MDSKPTYEELLQRIEELEQEKLENRMVRKGNFPDEEYPGHESSLKSSSGMNSSKIDLESVIDMEKIQSIMEDFYYLTNMLTAVTDMKGKVLVAVGWQDICVNFHREHPETAANCTESDLYLSKNLKPGEYAEYKCKNGLWDVVTPLFVGSEHMGNIFTGQFFYDDEKIDENYFVRQAERYGFDKDAYVAALRKVPKYTRDDVKHLMSFLIKFTAYISRIGYYNVQLENEVSERKQAETALIESEARLKTLIHTIPDLVWLKDVNGVYLSCNSRFESFFGAAENDIAGKTDYDFVDKILADSFREYDKLAISSRKPLINEEEIGFLDDGHREILETIKTPFYGADGVLAGVLGIGRDITHRKEIEKEVLKNKEGLQLLFDNSPVGICTVDLKGNFVTTNRAYEQMLGYSKDELSRLSFYDITHPDFRPKNKQLFQKMFSAETGSFFMEKVYIHKNGYPINVSVNGTAVRDNTGKRRFGTAFVEDITNRKQTEIELIQSKQLIDTVINGIVEPVFVKDEEHRWIMCNDSFCTMLGKSREELIGKSDYEFFPKNQADVFWEKDNFVLNSGKSFTNEENISVENQVRIVSTIKSPFVNPITGAKNIVGTVRDITDRRGIEEQLQQARKLESVGRLAGGVAHDYNNISSIIMGFSELALMKVDRADSLHDDLKEILAAAKRSTEITRQLLAFARQQTVAPKMLDLNNVIENMLKMLRRLIGEDINLVWLPKAELWPISIDPSQIDQIMANLCVNARDAIVDVGCVTIETDNVSFDDDYCNIHPGYIKGDYVCVAVSDDGSGMTQETIEKVFEPFFTTKGLGHGTGLGLATVYGIVKQNSGFINVYSELEKGTSIKIYLPKHQGEAVQLQKEIPPEIPSGNGETVLLVEDDAMILKLAAIMLRELGYAVISSTSPPKAIEMVREHKGKINLLITDVVMPEMNGRSLAEKLKSIYPDIRVLFMSGYTANVIAHRGVLDSDVSFISKPFSRDDFARKIREVLDQG